MCCSACLLGPTERYFDERSPIEYNQLYHKTRHPNDERIFEKKIAPLDRLTAQRHFLIARQFHFQSSLMEILSTDDDAPELVTNLEVLQILSQAAPTKKKQQRKAKVHHVDWIQQHVQEYLNKTPCAHIRQRDEMPTLVQKLKEDFGLTDAETLQILNFMPRESVEIHLIIQDLPSRLTEEKQEEVLTLIGSYVNKSDEQENGDDRKLAAKEETVETLDGGQPKEEILENGDVIMLQDQQDTSPAIKTEPL